MISNPDLVRYTCIAHNHHSNLQEGIDSVSDSTILAEFNSAESSLSGLAQQCLRHTPPHHSIFSQTSRNQTYTFSLDDPFVYFGIFDPKMMKSDQIELFGHLKDALNRILKVTPDQKFSPCCLQGELHPIFQSLVSKSVDFNSSHHLAVPNGVNHHIGNNSSTRGLPGPGSGSGSGSSKGRKIMVLPMLTSCKIGKGLKKKRSSVESVTDSKTALVDGKLDVLDADDDVGEVKSREIICQNGVCLMDGHPNLGRQKAKKIWRKHVWIVLVLDLAVCLILFGIWLFVCRGFECIEG